MTRFPLTALCLFVLPAAVQGQQAAPAATAQASPPAGEAPTPDTTAIQQAGMAFGQCIETGIGNVPASATPEAGAATVSSGCATQLHALEAAAEAFIAQLPEDQRATASEHLHTQLGQVEGQVADAIREQRAASATPAPAPAQPPAASPGH